MARSVREIHSRDWDALRALGERVDAGRLQDGDLCVSTIDAIGVPHVRAALREVAAPRRLSTGV